MSKLTAASVYRQVDPAINVTRRAAHRSTVLRAAALGIAGGAAVLAAATGTTSGMPTAHADDETYIDLLNSASTILDGSMHQLVLLPETTAAQFEEDYFESVQFFYQFDVFQDFVSASQAVPPAFGENSPILLAVGQEVLDAASNLAAADHAFEVDPSLADQLNLVDIDVTQTFPAELGILAAPILGAL